MEHSKIYVSTAQFAKLAGVSKQTLIYYDKMGIFHPSYVDEKKYRYYSLSQHDAFYVITMLRHLGTPLKEIKQYIENRNIDSFLTLLDKKQDEIKSKIAELNELSQLIDKRRAMTLYGMREKHTEDVVIYKMPEERIILSQPILDHNEMNFCNAIGDLESYIIDNNYKTFSTGAMIDKESILNKEYKNISHLYAKTDVMCERTHVKPAGEYAVTYHYGEYETTYLAYYRLIKYINDNGYEIAGNAYEDALLDFCTQRSESEYLSEISIQVELK